MLNIKPLVLIDLDDTIFQTVRKITEPPKHLASLNQAGEPSGYMTNKQYQLVKWLLNTADLVPVTARSRESYERVTLDFTYGAICSHGGVILSANGKLDEAWHNKMTADLQAYQTRLKELANLILAIADRLNLSLRCWVVKEQDTCFYVQVKHNKMSDEVLYQLREEIITSYPELLVDLSMPINGNNLAFIPKAVNKKYAVTEFIQQDKLLFGERPILGFGDSLSDLDFLGLSDFWGVPRKSQISQRVFDFLDK